MVLSAEVNGLILGPWDDASWEARCGQLRTDLEVFILGGVISVAERPFKGKSAYMKQLRPPVEEVWEIRSRDPKPSLRVFGRFAATDVFVALAWSDRASLGAAKSREWRDARERCKAEWRKLFPAFKPHSGRNLEDYISKGAFFV